jgi:hypothetical protein
MSDARRTRDPQAANGRHWLARPGTVRILWIVFGVVLATTVATELLVHLHPRFGAEGWFGFHAGYGFLACVGMVLFAKGLGALIQRPDDYYDRRSEAAEREEGRRD